MSKNVLRVNIKKSTVNRTFLKISRLAVRFCNLRENEKYFQTHLNEPWLLSFRIICKHRNAIRNFNKEGFISFYSIEIRRHPHYRGGEGGNVWCNLSIKQPHVETKENVLLRSCNQVKRSLSLIDFVSNKE